MKIEGKIYINNNDVFYPKTNTNQIVGFGTAVRNSLLNIDTIVCKEKQRNIYAEIKQSIQNGTYTSDYPIGSLVPITLNGTLYTHVLSNFKCYARVIGLDHNIGLETNNKKSITFQIGTFEDMEHTICFGPLPFDTQHQTDYVRWSYSEMRTIYMPQFFACLPNDLQNCIATVTKVTSWSNSTETFTETTTDTLFLLSATEIGAQSPINEDTEYTYSYYRDKSSLPTRRDNYTTDITAPLPEYGADNWIRTPCALAKGCGRVSVRPGAATGNANASNDIYTHISPAFVITE